MNLRIKALNTRTKKVYSDHGHFHEGDAGIDLYALEDQVVEAGETTRIHFGIACESLEEKPYFLIPRSSISKTPLRMSNSIGLIDAGYRGEIMASVDNIKSEDYTIKSGQRLFQLVAMNGSPIHIALVDELSETERGDGGFGSTGS
jgi:dUTP pyrophosphatase